MRHSAVFQYVKDYIKDKRVFSARAVSSSYLPDWRPNQDYREVYSAKKELGGGVVIDLIHEWDYVIDLFGMPEFQTVYHGKYSDLEITSDDLSAAILEYKDKLVEIHLDYFGRKNVRKLEIYLEGETIEADYINSMILLGNGKKIELLEESNEKYLRELKYYLRLLEGKEDNINDYKKAKQVLGLALGELL